MNDKYTLDEKGNPVVLWETMVFGGKLDQEQDRCSGSREQAEAMHARMVERVKRSDDADRKTAEDQKRGFYDRYGDGIDYGDYA
jgi:hypothetical protein